MFLEEIPFSPMEIVAAFLHFKASYTFSDKINLANIDILEEITDTSTIEQILSPKLGPEFWPCISNSTSPDGDWWKNVLIGKGKGRQLLYTALKNQQRLPA